MKEVFEKELNMIKETTEPSSDSKVDHDSDPQNQINEVRQTTYKRVMEPETNNDYQYSIPAFSLKNVSG